MITVREETAVDIPAIHQVNAAAFERAGEAELVDKLRQRGAITLSLVAEVAGQVVGHLLFTPVKVVPEAQGTAYEDIGEQCHAPGRVDGRCPWPCGGFARIPKSRCWR